MSKHKRINPAYVKGVNSEAWILAGKCKRENLNYNEMIVLAKTQSDDRGPLAHDTDDARREIGYRSGPSGSDRNTNLRRKIAERLPIRATLKNLPFYLRHSYTQVVGYDSGTTYIPNRSYNNCRDNYEYHPIDAMKANLHSKRTRLMQSSMEGLIRWVDTIGRSKCEFVVSPSFKGFSFKIKTGAVGNKLPTTKYYDSLGIIVRAPKEFFDQQFWGFGDHLVVRVLDKYENDDGITILKTLSCDRENLYALESPTILKERFYVHKDSMRGTGLTEHAAIRSLQYYMGKAVTFALGA